MDNWFSSNNVLKIVALLIGTMLWMVVNFNDTPGTIPQPQDSTMTIRDVKIIPYVDPNRYSTVTVEPERVNISVTGKVSALSQVGDFEVYVDLADLGPGTHPNVPVKLRGLPVNVTAQVSPSFVQVYLEEKVMKETPVTLDITGTPAVGYKMGQPIISPNHVKLVGSESLLAEVHRIAGVVDVQDVEKEVQQKVKLTAYDEAGNPLEVAIEPQVVSVVIPISTPFKKLPFILDYTGQVPDGFAIADIRKSVDQITVYGSQDVLDVLDFYMGPGTRCNEHDRVQEVPAGHSCSWWGFTNRSETSRGRSENRHVGEKNV